MWEVNSLSRDSRALRAEYCIVGIPHNTAVWFLLLPYWHGRSVNYFQAHMALVVVYNFTSNLRLCPVSCKANLLEIYCYICSV